MVVLFQFEMSFPLHKTLFNPSCQLLAVTRIQAEEGYVPRIYNTTRYDSVKDRARRRLRRQLISNEAERRGTGNIETQVWCPKVIFRLPDSYQCVREYVRSTGEPLHMVDLI